MGKQCSSRSHKLRFSMEISEKPTRAWRLVYRPKLDQEINVALVRITFALDAAVGFNGNDGYVYNLAGKQCHNVSCRRIRKLFVSPHCATSRIQIDAAL